MAAAPPEPALKLLSAGKAPTQALRRSPKKGAKITIVTTNTGTQARGARGKLGAPEPTPGVRTVADVDVTDVQATGYSQVDRPLPGRSSWSCADRVAPRDR